MSIYIVLVLLYVIGTAVGLGKIFEKAGHQGWKAFVPIYNLYIWIKIIDKSAWWYLYAAIPFINIFVILLMIVETVKCFKKFGLGAQTLAVIFPFIYLPYLGFSKKEKYIQPKDLPVYKKGQIREWADAIIFAVIAATIIRTFFIEAYTIPSSSMEKSLLVGDFLFVSKLAYGPRIPNTPIAVPLVHHTLPLTQTTPSYLTWLNLDYYRFPGLGHVKRYDAVVFNFPDGDTLSTTYQSNESYYSLVRKYGREVVWSNKQEFGDIIARPVDKRENFIKRCIGMPGETLQVVNGQVVINGKKLEQPVESENTYRVQMKAGAFIDKKALEKLDISEEDMKYMGIFQYVNLTKRELQLLEKMPAVASVQPLQPTNNVQLAYQNADSAAMLTCQIAFYQNFTEQDLLSLGISTSSIQNLRNDVSATLPLTKEVAEKLKQYPFVASVSPVTYMNGYYDEKIFPHNKESYAWNTDFFGPLHIPKKGETIELTPNNLLFYTRVINIFEGNKLEVKNNEVFINGQKATHYTFKMDYYFMMGDNRHNSADSRFWGFVPEDHVVGKASFVWLSLNKDKSFPKNIRWNKLFRIVR